MRITTTSIAFLLLFALSLLVLGMLLAQIASVQARNATAVVLAAGGSPGPFNPNEATAPQPARDAR